MFDHDAIPPDDLVECLLGIGEQVVAPGFGGLHQVRQSDVVLDVVATFVHHCGLRAVLC